MRVAKDLQRAFVLFSSAGSLQKLLAGKPKVGLYHIKVIGHPARNILVISPPAKQHKIIIFFVCRDG